MGKKVRNIAVTAAFALFFGIGAVTCLLHSPQAFSMSERRELAQFPAFTWQNVLNTSFMTDFEDYTLDQFPLRDDWRRIKSIAHYYLFAQKDNNDIYIADSMVSKLEYPLNENSVNYAAKMIRTLQELYYSDMDANLYYSIVPDKNYFLAEKNGYPSMDYDKLVSIMNENLADIPYIDLFPSLDLEDYYRTDTHWRQEALSDVTDTLANAMEIGEWLTDTYTEHEYYPFYGVYSGQAALPLSPDTLVYLRSETLDGCIVYNYETNTTGSIYDMEKLESADSYEVFLSGAAALLTIENPACTSGRELVLFRDSFGSSIAPLLVSAYSKITIVDIRYVPSAYIGQIVDISEADDVLFLYSTLVLNNAAIMK